MTAKYDTVVFDLDGTLLDTLDDLTDSVNYALEKYGFPKRPREDIRRFVGNGVGRLVAQCLPDGADTPEFEACLADMKAHYQENMRNKTGPYPGIPELLEALKRKGVRMAIVSNKPDPAVKGLCPQYFGAYTNVAIGETESVRRKPAPDSVHKALEELGSDAARAVYVGDSEVDVKTARNAGLYCVGVTWGFRDRSVLEEEGADRIIDKPEELLDIIG